MPSNSSKTRQSHSWKKWYGSGAVQQPTFPKGSLTVSMAMTSYSGLMANKTHLILGWELDCTKPPLWEGIVPAGFWGYDIGLVLDKIPANAVPINCYPKIHPAF